MHGCGNDYIYINGFEETVADPSSVAVNLSRRHFSVGADGIIIVCPSAVADAKMTMYNADGSEGRMCGNGIRCVAKFVHDNNISKNNPLKIETLSGIKTVWLHCSSGKVTSASVDMGYAEFAPDKVPVISSDGLPVINKEYLFGDVSYKITCVSMGNPHCVIFVEKDFDLDGFNLKEEGSKIENSSFFPDKTNVEFVKQIDRTHFEMRVWERGSGETYACGTGACGVVAAAYMNGMCDENTNISVKLKGGTLEIIYTPEKIILKGDAQTSFIGRAEI